MQASTARRSSNYSSTTFSGPSFPPNVCTDMTPSTNTHDWFDLSVWPCILPCCRGQRVLFAPIMTALHLHRCVVLDAPRCRGNSKHCAVVRHHAPRNCLRCGAMSNDGRRPVAQQTTTTTTLRERARFAFHGCGLGGLGRTHAHSDKRPSLSMADE